jgi:hypothetical protein
MCCLKNLLVVIAVAASTASNAQPTKALDIRNLDAAEKLWAHVSLQNYQFTFKYIEFVSPCHFWAFDVRVSHGVPEHQSDCRRRSTRDSDHRPRTSGPTSHNWHAGGATVAS